MRKILVVTSSFPKFSGDNNGNFIYDLYKNLSQKYEITILAPNSPTTNINYNLDNLNLINFRYFLKKYEILSGSTGMFPSIKKNPFLIILIPFFILGQFIALRRYINKTNPDIIHAHWVIPQGITVYLNFLIFKNPYIVTCHGSDITTLSFLNIIKKRILTNAKTVTVVSNHLKSIILDKISKQIDIKIIPMGVDTNIFCPQAKDPSIRTRYNISSQFLLFVGRLAPEKGVINLIKAIPKLILKFPSLKLLIIGDGILMPTLKTLCKNLKITKHVVFLGNIPHQLLPPFYATADIFVCPSTREGTPGTYLEALSSGTPIAVGDIPISHELLKFGYGTTLNSDNYLDIAKKITSIIINPNPNRLKIRKDFLNKYDWKAVRKEFNHLYSSL